MSDAYAGRDQTFAKHFILKRYLQTLSFKILSSGFPALTYVDGFSGPWHSKRDDLSDTSFMIALSVLKETQRVLIEQGKTKEVRCFFVEYEDEPFRQLHAAVMRYHDPANNFHVATFHGKFEDAVPKILGFAKGFLLTFIDPTGWTGYPFPKIAPLLLHEPGEVLINFMYDHINRFAGSDDPTIRSSFDGILGGPNWQSRMDRNLPPGQAAQQLFREQLREAGDFRYVLATTIEKSTSDRPHFSIAYATRSPSGLKAFRQVEYEALRDHTRRRASAKQERETARTGQSSLFGADDLPDSIAAIVSENRRLAKAWLSDFLAREVPIDFQLLWPLVLEKFMLRETDVKTICVEMANEGLIGAPWKADGFRTPHDTHIIKLKD